VSTWTPSPDHPGYRTKVITRGNCTITLLRPDLTADEAAKREQHAKSVMESALKNYIYKGDKKQ
jgi:hypothetical protein